MNAIEAMQMTAYDLAELQRQVSALDELLNDAVNALDIITRGKGMAGETINRKRYAAEVAQHIRDRWGALQEGYYKRDEGIMIKRLITSPEVWAVIHARHGADLCVFSSLSNPDGDAYGNREQGRMFTEYGIKGADYPLIAADTRWDIDRQKPNERRNVQTEYWLCVPEKESE